MKLTWLEIVQDILNSMDSDDVNDINDTVESFQVGQIVKTAYYELISRRDWAHLKELFQLTSSESTVRPTHLTVPTRIVEIREIKYDKAKTGETRKKYEAVKYMEPEKFLVLCNARNSDASNIDTITDPTGVELLIRNDAAPEYYTSFDDETIVCDSYDSAVETYMATAKTQCWGIRQPEWVDNNGHIPDLPDDAFPLLVAEAKSVAQMQLRQFKDDSAIAQATRQRYRMSQKSWTVNKQNRYPNYGRSIRRGRGTPPKDGYNG